MGKVVNILIILILVFFQYAYSQIQSDKSDTLWSVVKPLPNCLNINMNQCEIGQVKDSVCDDFISNIGSWKFKVEAIYFRSGDSNSFSLVSGLPPYLLDKNRNMATEFRFIPERIGHHQSEIVVITQNDTIIRTISGEGVKKYLELTSNIIDFGKVEIGDEKTFTDTILIKNISGEEVIISNTSQLPPDIEQFIIINGGGQFTLQPDEVRRMTLQFKPKYGGRTSGRIAFDYGFGGSPAIAELFGTGIGGLVKVENDSGYPGDISNIKITLQKVKPEGLASIAGNFIIKLKFQKTLLASANNSNWFIDKDSTYLTVEGKLMNTFELITIPLKVGLGNVEETSIDIVEFQLKDDRGNIINYDIEKKSGLFKLLGVCEEGGKRLFDADNYVFLSKVQPNPSAGEFQIDVTLIERGFTEIYLINSLGEKILDILCSDVDKPGKFSYNINTSSLPSATYFIVLQTPTIKKIEKIIIEK